VDVESPMHLWIMLEERNTDVSKCINRYTVGRQVTFN